MSEENVEIVRQVYDAVARRDPAGVLALYDEEIEIDATRLPEARLVERGIIRGHDGLRRVTRSWDEAWASAEDRCEELIDAGEHVISVVARQGIGRASGLRVDTQRAGVWTVRDRKVVRTVWFPTKAEALQAAGLSE